MEDDDQRVHLRNLGVHRVGSEEEALNLVGICPACQAPAA